MAGPASARRRRGARGSAVHATASAAPHVAGVTARIVAARHARRTAWAIAVQLQVPRSTVAAVLARAGPQSARAPHARRRPSCGMNGRSRASWCISMSNRSRALPGSATGFMGIGARAWQGIGWEYAHVAVDDHSRAAYVEVLPDQTGDATAGFLTRTVAWFAQRGVRHRPGADRQRRQLSQSALSRRRRAPHRPPETHPPVSAADQRQSRTLHPDADSANGRMRALSRPRLGARAPWPPWLRALQHRPPARRAWATKPPCSRFPRVAQ